MAKELPVKQVAKDLNVREQIIYKLIRQDKLEWTKPEGSRSKCVDPDLTAQAIKEDKIRTKNNGGRYLNWSALIEYLQESNEKEVSLDVNELREILEASKAKLGMLHYWDPLRASYNNGQAPGLKAIRAAGFELKSISFAYSELTGMVGAATITVRRCE